MNKIYGNRLKKTTIYLTIKKLSSASSYFIPQDNNDIYIYINKVIR